MKYLLLLLLATSAHAAAVRDWPTGTLTFTQIVTPSAPASGKDACYTKSDDKLYCYSHGATETQIGAQGNLSGAITSSGLVTSIGSQTGTGSKFVVDTSPTLVTPNLGTPSAVVLTNATGFPTLNQNTSGTAADLSATLSIAHGGTANVTAAAAFNALSPMTTGGDLIYGGASGAATRLANGPATYVLTSNGTTLAPTWNAPSGGSTTYSNPFGTGARSEAFGLNAGGGASTANDDAAFGNGALHASDTGGVNSAFGSGALAANTSGANNVAMGYYALNANTSGLDNVAIGYEAMFNQATLSTHSTAVGYLANGGAGAGSSYATCIGASACGTYGQMTNDTCIGALSCGATSYGTSNACVGTDSCYAIITNGNVAIGYDAAYATGSSNSTFLGLEAGDGYSGSASACIGAWSCSVNQAVVKTLVIGGAAKSATYAINNVVVSGTPPAVSACGTSPPAVVGSDTAGRITVGTGGTATSCTITFATAFVNTPACIVEDESAVLTLQPGPTTTTLVVTSTVAFGASAVLDYICIGSQ
jgi:hypothetical protein